MPYTINKTNGDVLVTVPDGSVDIITTDIALIGKNAPSYGEYQNENFVALLENFASGSQPSNPLTGQLWYDSGGDNRIKVYNGTAFRPISGAIVSASQPSTVTSVIGDMWMDSNTGQLHVKHSTGWRLVGPIWSVTDNTLGLQVDTVTDTGTATSRKVVGIYSNGTRIGIVSDHTAFNTSISGFTTIGKGITLNTSLANNKFHGIATEAESVSGFTPGSFMRADANTGTTGTLTVNNNDGLIIGESSELTATISNHDAYIDNNFVNSDIYFRTYDGATYTTVLTVDGDNKRVGVKTVSPTADFEVTGSGKFNGDLTVTGNINITSSLLPTGTATSKVATTEFVRQEINNLINASPGALDTLNELAVAINNDASFATTVTNSLANKLSLSGGTLTGYLTLHAAPTANNHAATKNYVDTAISTGTSGLNANKIYRGTVGTSNYSEFSVNTSNGELSMTYNNSTVMTSSAGIPLFYKALKINTGVDGTSFSRAVDYSTSDWPKILVSAGFVQEANQYWSGSAKFVSTSTPTGGQDGDFWFQREA